MIVQKLTNSRKGNEKQSELAGNPRLLTLDDPRAWLTGRLPENITPENAKKLSAVYRAVHYIGAFVSALPVYVYDKDNRDRVKDHYLKSLLALRPNAWMTPSNLKLCQIDQLLLRGNAYTYIGRDNKTGRPKELLLLDADYMQPSVIDGVFAYLYHHPNTGKLYRLDCQDVLHYKIHSSDGYVGESVLKYAARTLGVAEAGSQYEAAVYEYGTHPAGVLTTDTDLGGPSDKEDPDQPGKFISKKENIRRAWEAVHAGAANAFRTAVLDNGLKYQPIAVSSFDAQFIAARNVTVEDIARFFGVPLHALMTGKQSYASNEQNSLEFIQGDGLAIIRMMEEEDSYKLLLGSDLDKNYWIKRNLDARLRGDTAARGAFYRNMRDIGAYSVNDVLELEDRPSVEGGDVRMASLNYVPLENFKDLSLDRNKTVETAAK